MKKTLSILLILSMILSLCLTACNNDVATGDGDSTSIMGGEITTSSTESQGSVDNEPPVDEDPREPLYEVKLPVAPEELSEGLVFEPDEANDGYALVGLGTCTDTIINIPASYNDKPVTKIAESAFKFNHKVTEIYMPDTVVELENGVFFCCDALETVLLSSSLKYIPESAFWKSTIKSIVIPDSVTYIIENAFDYCANLESIKLGKGVTQLGADINYGGNLEFSYVNDFGNCDSLRYIVVDEDHPTFTSINGSLYSKDETILVRYAIGREDATFTIPSSVTTIGESAFLTANNLEEMEIPSTVEKMLYGSFRRCAKLRKITIPASVKEYGLYVLNNCISLEEIVVAGENEILKSVDGNLYSKDGKQFLQYALGLSAEKFVVPDGVEYIGIYSFSEAPNLKEVVIPEGVIEVTNNAFEKCAALEIVSLPSTIQILEFYSFADCTALKLIKYNGTEEMWESISKKWYWADRAGKYTLEFAE